MRRAVVIVSEVVAPHLEDAARQRLDMRRVEVDGQHRALWRDPFGHPGRDRPAARAGFQAAPAGTDPQRVQKRPCPPVPRRLDARQPLRLVVLEPVARYGLTPDGLLSGRYRTPGDR